MAFIRESNNEDEQNQSLATSSSGGSTIGSTSTMNKTVPKKGSGGFTNINSYIEANKPQAAALGQGIASNIDKQSNVAKTGLNTAKTNFQTATTPEVTRVNQGQSLVDDSFNKATSGQRLDSGTLSNFSKFRNNEGQALQVDSSLDKVRSEAEKAQGYYDSSQNASGRTQLLSNFYGQPTYSAGQKKLDQLLLQATPGLTKALTQQAKASTTGLVGSVDTEKTNEAALIADTTAKRNALQKLINDRTNEYMTGLRSDLDKNLTEKQAERSNIFNTSKSTIEENIASGKYTQAQDIIKNLTGQDIDLSGLKSRDYFTRGLTDYWKGQFLSGVGGNVDDYMNYVKQAVSPYLREGEQLNLNTATTDPLRAKYQALSDLAGLSANERILAEQGIAPSLVGEIDLDPVKSNLTSLSNIQANINKDLEHTYDRYQNRDEDAFRIAKAIKETGKATPGLGVDESYARAEMLDREFDLADINKKLNEYAALRAGRS